MFRRIYITVGLVLAILAAVASISFYSALLLRQNMNVPFNFAPAVFAAVPSILGDLSSNDLKPDFSPVSAADRSEMIKLANLALRIDPTSPAPLRLLGQLSAADGERSRARQLILAGDTLNHRDRQANLWLIEDSIRAGNLDEGLSYFDQLLRTLGDDRGSVIALLTQVLSDERAIRPLEKILRRQPNWSEQFWLFVPGNAQVLKNAAELRVKLDDSMKPEERKSDSVLIGALADAGHYAAGFRVAKTIYPDLTLGGVNNADFSSSVNVAPYNWQTTGSNAFAVNVSERAKTLQITSSPGSSGDIVRQLVRLDPGAYRPVVNVAADSQNQSLPELSLSLECARSGDRQSVLVGPQTIRETSQSSLIAKADCDWYWLVLSSGYSMSAYDLSLDRIDLEP